MKKFLTICVFVTLAVTSASAQMRMERRPCIQDSKGAGTRLEDLKKDWDPSRTYPQAVILVTYQDQDFSMSNPYEHYDSLFNVKGYNERNANGCVADYFRDQSNGMFNVKFDIIGPVRVAQSVKSKSSDNQGGEVFHDATQIALDSLKVDFSPYDWDGDGEVDQIIFVSAGYCANGSGGTKNGYLWPNTGSFYPIIRTADGLELSNYTASAEKWYNDIPCGLGTICHEYCHCFGLPDLYPTDKSSFSVVDEWDLMDGGNYTCWGWSPPNLSAMEKLVLGWITPEEITGPAKVKNLKPLAEGGKCYRSTILGDEYYLLENRQQSGWDFGAPGKGLLVTYVNYSSTTWRWNSVNTSWKKNYHIIPADGMDYDAWEDFVEAMGMTEYEDDANRFRRHHLSTSPYPVKNDSTDVHECSLSPYSFTNIKMASDGSISFEIVKGETGIEGVKEEVKSEGVKSEKWYDLQGRLLLGKPQRKGLYIRNGKKEIIR